MPKFEGLPVVDATRALELHVQQRDVDRKQRKNPAKCALAACSERQFKTEARVYMSRAYVKSADGSYWTRYVVPTSAQREITAFDRGARSEPGIYRLTPPSETSKLGANYKPASHRSPPTGKAPRPIHFSINVRQRAPFGGKDRRTD